MSKNKFYCHECKEEIIPFDDDKKGTPRMCEDCFEKLQNDADLEKDFEDNCQCGHSYSLHTIFRSCTKCERRCIKGV